MLLPFLAATQPAAAQSYFNSWPAGAAPAEIGLRVAENWAARKFGFESGATDKYGSHVHYAEVVTWYGALNVARLANASDLDQRLVRKFDMFLSPDGARRIAPDRHVDFSIFGALPLEIYLHNKSPRYLEMGQSFADRQWQDATPDGISREARYWADDMYMLPLLQLQAHRATGKREYLDRTALTMEAYLKRLQQPNGLFYHGEGSPFFWGRGNGWIAAGMTELLRDLPAGHPRREAILSGYRRMMATLRAQQTAEGLWRQLIDRPEVWVEGSASAMFTFAMITGVKEGWLAPATYGLAARRAWLGLVSLLDADANLREICVGTGKAAGEVGNDLDAQYRFYVERPRRTGDLHGQAPVLWTVAALLRPTRQ